MADAWDSLDQLLDEPSDEAPAAKRPRPPTPIDLELDPHSGIRIRKDPRYVSRDELKSLASTFAVKRVDEVPAMLRKPPASFPSAWLTICVLIDKGIPKESKDGRRFAMWKFSDLRNPMATATTISVFLFGEAYSSAQPRELVGSVYALLTPEALPPKDGQPASEPALSIKHPKQLLRIGESVEFGQCKADRKDGGRCTMAVNTTECEFCEFHVGAKMREIERNLAKSRKKDTMQQQQQQQQQQQNIAPQSQRFSSSGGVQVRGCDGVIYDVRNLADHPKILAELEKVKASRAAMELYQAPDPNSEHSNRLITQAQFQSGAKLATAGSASVAGSTAASLASASGGGGGYDRRGAPPPTAAKAAPTAFTKEFGAVRADSSKGLKLRDARPTQAGKELEQSRASQASRLDYLAKKDAMHEKAMSKTVVDIKTYACKECGYKECERARPECAAEGHTLITSMMKKRGFRCAKCKHHTTAINKRWPGPCIKCKGDTWKDASVRRDKEVALPGSDFLARGEEHGKFRNSVAPPPQQGTTAAPLPSRSSAHSARGSYNAWQAQLPETD